MELLGVQSGFQLIEDEQQFDLLVREQGPTGSVLERVERRRFFDRCNLFYGLDSLFAKIREVRDAKLSFLGSDSYRSIANLKVSSERIRVFIRPICLSQQESRTGRERHAREYDRRCDSAYIDIVDHLVHPPFE
jgi:hypothetical protein